jgi:hypothetical protein
MTVSEAGRRSTKQAANSTMYTPFQLKRILGDGYQDQVALAVDGSGSRSRKLDKELG